MTILSIKDAGFVAQHHLFKNLTFTLNANDRMGLVAQNGAGKSTLLRCLEGELELGSGEIFRSRGVRVGYMAQDVDPALMNLTFHNALLSALPDDAVEGEGWRVDMVLDTLDTPQVTRDAKVSELSGGWQRLMLLARVWVTEPDVLLMDEPTNHLDLEKILVLETWLNTWVGDVPVIIASHDRSFLNAITNRTLFLRPEISHLFTLPYSRARAELIHIDTAQAVEQERKLNEANQLRRQSAKLKNIGINSGSDLLLKKQKQLRERAEKIEEEASNLHAERRGEIRLSNRGTHAKSLIRIENLSVVTPDDRALFHIEKLDVFQGDRIVILARNGLGKSTLVRMLRRVLMEGDDVQGIRTTPSLVTGYMDQALFDIPLDVTPFEFIAARAQNDAHARSNLATAGIAYDWQSRPIRTLSLGQRSRVALLALRFMKPNFYLLDEPTNHVDIAGQDDLAEEIRIRGASCILVSHDRTFVQEIGTRFWCIERGKLCERESSDEYFSVDNNQC